VRLELGEPISTAGLGPADREALVNRVRGRVAEMLGAPAGLPGAGAEEKAQ